MALTLCYTMLVTKLQKLRTYALLALTPLLFASSMTGAATAVGSTQLQSQLSDIRSQIADGQAKAKELAAQADSLKKTIAELDLQIQQQDAEIVQTGLRIQELQQKLDQTQAELERQKELLRDSIRALYKKGGASTVELLIGSDSFSQFIDSQEYLTRLKSAIQDSTNKVIALKHELQAQQDQQQVLLKQQQDQKATVEASRKDRQAVLDQTQGDEARYQSMVADLRAQQAEVNKQLAAALRFETGSGSGNNGGYPYDNQPFSMIPYVGCGPVEGPDRWGYCYRQCVSYAAWAVERSGRKPPMYYGNAIDWIWHAQNYGIPVDHTPRDGDVVIFPIGRYGHAAYVEKVNGDGTMLISQYNLNVDGKYTEATMTIGTWNPYFLHFQ